MAGGECSQQPPRGSTIQERGLPACYKRAMSDDAHRWTFFRAGDFDQVKLASGADLANLDALDQKLWVALACPTNGLEIDARTLALIDTDKDGRVRAPELIAAVTFACANLKDPDDLFKGERRPAARRDQRRAPRGEDAAGVGPAHPGRHRQDGRHLDQPRGRRRSGPHLRRHRLQRRRRHHRDGRRGRRHPRAHPRDRRDASAPCRIAPESRASTARSPTRSSPRRAPTAPGTRGAKRARPTFFPLGPERTASAVAAVAAIKPKVDDYFGRCRLAAFDPRALPVAEPQRRGVPADRRADLTISVEEIAGFPLALAAADRPLPLGGRGQPGPRGGRSGRSATTRWRRCSGARAELTESDWLALRRASSRPTTPGSP